MIKRHEEQILNRFDELYVNGCTQFTRGELRLWYGLTKVTKTIYADLYNRWTTMLEANLGEKEAQKELESGHEKIWVLPKGDSLILFRNSMCKDLGEM